MAERMNKRARLAAHSSTTEAGTTSVEEGREDRPSKRTKAHSVDHSQLTLGDDPMSGDYMLDVFSQTSLQLSTPFQAVPSDCSMFPSSAVRPSTAPDQLSPLPLAKRILSRTSSRNFKENAGQRSSRSLASPFNSRPGSRASSPKKPPKKRRGHHTKSRTLSQSGALKEKIVDRNIPASLQTNAGLPLHPNATHISDIDAHDKAPAAAHNRASSIPTFRPALDQTWLVPPKTLSRSSPVADSDTEGDNLRRMNVDHEHPSFGRDAPLYVSTPPRRQRSATVGAWAHGLMPQIDAEPPPPVHSFRYDSEVDMTDSSRPGSPTDSRPARANPPRRRRRTIVHMSSDSLFSSSLDFSALMSETERLPRAPPQDGSRSPQETVAAANSELAPAFSLHNSPVETSRRTSSDRTVTLARCGSFVPDSLALAADGDVNLPGPMHSSRNSSRSARLGPGVDGDELLDLFSVLGLDGAFPHPCPLLRISEKLHRHTTLADQPTCFIEDEKWGPPAGADDSGIAFSTTGAQSAQPSSKGGRVRRKRGDTIRASDFSKLPASASFDGGSGSGLAAAPRPPPRRARSGTVTQAATASTSGSGRRKHEGWPTIKMRTTAEPLRVDGDDADDELLLKDGDVVD